jgi:hypothetical protein
VTSSPTKPGTSRISENVSCGTHKRKRRSNVAPNHTMVQEMLSVQRGILANTESMAASLSVLTAAVVRIANAVVITQPLANQ